MRDNFLVRNSVIKGGRIGGVLLAFALLLVLSLAAGAPNATPRAQPIVLQMAAEHPDAMLGVIVQKSVKDASVEEIVAHLGGRVTQDLSIINAFVAEMPASAVQQLATANGVRWISLDAPVVQSAGPIKVQNLVSAYIKTVGADRVWNEGPAYLQGQGIGVAIVDSGDCSGCGDILTQGNKPRTVAAVVAAIGAKAGDADPKDFYGHGALVEGVVGGSASNGKYIGVAPGVNFVSVKIANNLGESKTSDVVAGLQWVLQNRAAYNIRVVNLSLNSTVAESYQKSPLDAAVEVLWFNRIVVVVAAGNNGVSSSGVVYPPANDPFAITVGATNDQGTASLADDVLAPFSAFGTTTDGFAKPDLVAPGTNLVSIVPKYKNKIWKDHSDHRVPDSGNNEYYMRVSGTSFSAPIVSGAVALLLQSNPNLTPDQVKYRLMATANKNSPGYSAAKLGAGTLDIYAAVHGTSTTSSNKGLLPSKLLTTGKAPMAWTSVNWDSVNWDSVNWDSVNWDSVNWDSVNWDSDYWGK